MTISLTDNHFRAILSQVTHGVEANRRVTSFGWIGYLARKKRLDVALFPVWHSRNEAERRSE
jgi:hypothetical protein